MRLVAHAHQDGSDLQSAALHLENVADARGCIGMGKDQHIRRPVHTIAGQDTLAQFGIEGGVDVHFALIAEIMAVAVQQFDRTAQSPAGALTLVAELRLRAKGDLWLNPKAAHVAGGPDGNLCYLLG